jgi:hypothetical protein
LVHHSHVEVDVGDFGMVLAHSNLHDRKCLVNALKCHREVATVQVVHGQAGVVLTDTRMVKSHQLLSENGRLRHQFYGLEEVS